MKDRYCLLLFFLLVTVVVILHLHEFSRYVMVFESSSFSLQQQQQQEYLDYYDLTTADDDDDEEEDQKPIKHHHHHRRLSGREIVEKAYNESFAYLDGPCGLTSNDDVSIVGVKSYNNNNNKYIPYRKCLKDVRMNHPNKGEWPWWFQTLLRDSDDGPLFGSWHNLNMIHPVMRFCAIEKIGTKHWRRLQCMVNDHKQYRGAPCPPTLQQYKTHIVDSFGRYKQSVPRVVFLRDPLERFLSAFIDKCILLRQEKHCEPISIFHNDNEMKDFLSPRQNQKQLFEAYVETMPLKWNMHFFPLSMYCDGLGRHIQHYTFVGNMGETFYHDIAKLGKLLGGSSSGTSSSDNSTTTTTELSKFEMQLDDLFHYQEKISSLNHHNHHHRRATAATITITNVANNNNESSFNNTSSSSSLVTPTMKQFKNLYSMYSKYQEHSNITASNNPRANHAGVETGAASRVHDYFTPKTVKRLLQYFSIDYIKLNLPIPDWAEEMLANE